MKEKCALYTFITRIWACQGPSTPTPPFNHVSEVIQCKWISNGEGLIFQEFSIEPFWFAIWLVKRTEFVMDTFLKNSNSRGWVKDYRLTILTIHLKPLKLQDGIINHAQEYQEVDANKKALNITAYGLNSRRAGNPKTISRIRYWPKGNKRL